MEVTSALQSEQHVKKELARKVGELQEKLSECKEMVRLCLICLVSLAMKGASMWRRDRGRKWDGEVGLSMFPGSELGHLFRNSLCSVSALQSE